MNKHEIAEALQKMDVSTARGRMELEKRAISLDPIGFEIADAAESRVYGYIRIYDELRSCVESNKYGIKDDELEKVEFIREQLYDLAKKTNLLALEYRMK